MNKKADETWARVAACEIQRSFHITKPADIEIEDIAWDRGVAVIEAPLDSGEAWLIRKAGGKKGIIRVHQDIPEEGRKRFAIAHELGHWELHPNESQFHLITVGDLGLLYARSPSEMEANAFASELLLPEFLFAPLCEKEQPSLALISKLAEEFRTTLSATAVRYIDLCTEPCAVIFSANSQVKWWRSSKEIKERGLWIDPGQPIHPHTFAHDCFDGKSVPHTMEEVPASAWFPRTESLIDQRIRESSLMLNRYETVITLLWLEPEPD